MAHAIELTLRIEGENVTVIQVKKASPQSGATPAETLDKIIAHFKPRAPLPAQARRDSATRRLQRQIENELAQDNQRIGIHLISRITQGMLTDPTGVLAKIRADQIFGMLELAELLDLNDDMREFLENHHAAILRGLR